MTNKDASIIIGNIPIEGDDCYTIAEYQEAKARAIQALEQQPSEDCISREEAQDLISRWLSDYLLDETREALETINYKVGDMPPVKPERPKGKWIEYKVDIAPHPLHCSLCGFSNHYISNRYMREFRRCPNCGAEMSGGEEDETDN